MLVLLLVLVGYQKTFPAVNSLLHVESLTTNSISSVDPVHAARGRATHGTKPRSRCGIAQIAEAPVTAGQEGPPALSFIADDAHVVVVFSSSVVLSRSLASVAIFHDALYCLTSKGFIILPL